MNETRIQELIEQLDGSGSPLEWQAISELRSMGDALAEHLRAKYHQSRNWGVRCACVFYSLKYARDNNETAIALGREALRDRSKAVRYRACMLLAFSLRRDALDELRDAMRCLSGRPGADDVAAAIDAIEHQNHNYFVDRDHSGKVKMTIKDV
jgi:hypothetical protein